MGNMSWTWRAYISHKWWNITCSYQDKWFFTPSELYLRWKIPFISCLSFAKRCCVLFIINIRGECQLPDDYLLLNSLLLSCIDFFVKSVRLSLLKQRSEHKPFETNSSQQKPKLSHLRIQSYKIMSAFYYQLEQNSQLQNLLNLESRWFKIFQMSFLMMNNSITVPFEQYWNHRDSLR